MVVFNSVIRLVSNMVKQGYLKKEVEEINNIKIPHLRAVRRAETMAKAINSENYYTVYYWMSTELGLSGVEKDLYAIIYYYYEKMNNECYYSYSQLEQITGTYKNKIIRSLTKLEEGGYIRIMTKENGKKYYQIIEDKLAGIQTSSNTAEIF